MLRELGNRVQLPSTFDGHSALSSPEPTVLWELSNQVQLPSRHQKTWMVIQSSPLQSLLQCSESGVIMSSFQADIRRLGWSSSHLLSRACYSVLGVEPPFPAPNGHERTSVIAESCPSWTRKLSQPAVPAMWLTPPPRWALNGGPRCSGRHQKTWMVIQSSPLQSLLQCSGRWVIMSRFQAPADIKTLG